MKALHECPNGEVITRTEKLVGIVLGDAHQDRRDRHTFPSIAEIAEDAMVSERQCQRVMDALERKGVIRREYPAGKGRGKTTFYIFCELDCRVADSDWAAGKVARRDADASPKGCHGVTLLAGKKAAPVLVERVTEGCHKGDILPRAYKEEHEQEQQEQVHPPTPLPGGERFAVHPLLLSEAVDGVMRACRWTDRRQRHTVSTQLRLAVSLGEELALVAARMIAAWSQHLDAAADGLLRGAAYGPKKFIGLGMWNDVDGWHWDVELLRRRAEASVGTLR